MDEHDRWAGMVSAAGRPRVDVQRLVNTGVGPQVESGLRWTGPHRVTRRRLVVVATLDGVAQAIAHTP